MNEQTDFRQQLRAWLEENCPESMRTPVSGTEEHYWGGRNPQCDNPDQKIWFDRMSAKGWIAPTWPTEYGGGGLNKEQAKVLNDEMRRISARIPILSMGLIMLGPVLLKFGTEEQKQKYLPPIVKGEIRWCQGYSEPNAGSDLASLATKAEDCGDHYLINGQKIWTSHADKADWIFCLVRTDSSGKNQNGISFVLFDMASEGVSTRPIKMISGVSPFCETFFDNVKAYKENLIGEEGKGWEIAKYLLTHERENVGGKVMTTGPGLDELAKSNIGVDDSGKLNDLMLRQQIARYQIDRLAFKCTTDRVSAELESGQGLGPASSIFKYYGVDLNMRRNELNLSIHGETALGWDGDEYDGGVLCRDWLRSKGNSIEGGTSEIQLNIIAKRVLGLPDA